MMAPDGSVRPHWQRLVDSLVDTPPAQWSARMANIERLLRDHGVTYNIYSDSHGTTRQWPLDAVPFIVSGAEWRMVATGLQQRSQLLNMILADIYGPQRLMREGWLPPSFLQSNPGFLRAACGVQPPGGAFLVSMGTDLIRNPDGAWIALAERTQCPSGRGYAFENRNIMAEVLGDVFESSRVERLGGFFEAERDALRLLAPTRRGTPSVVLLSPGPRNETYFEHAYKSRIMGYPLVEGADLTVRDRKLFLKTLEGLRRVDVVLRRVEDVYADPLELRADTWQGVAGLCEAWRAGNVSLVNGIGTGAVETPALYPFMEAICRELLGEDLKLASVATWWCGQPRELALVLENPRRWVLKPAFPGTSRDPVFLDSLAKADLDLLLAEVRSEPQAWVAQEPQALSTAPVWNGSRLVPRQLVWSAFSINSGQRCTVMPGGLSRVGPTAGRFIVKMQRGGISKDTWVLNDESVVPGIPEPSGPPVVLRPLRTPGGVPSRAADHLYWLGRYVERLEWHARLLRTTLQRLSGEGSSVQLKERGACMQFLKEAELIPSATTDAGLRRELLSLLTNASHNGSVPDLVSRIRFNAAAARDRLSDDSWRLLNRLEHDAAFPSQPPLNVTAARGLFDTLILDLAAFSGMQQENMTRGHGWRFLETGRRIERVIGVLTLVRSTAARTADDDALPPLLEVCDSSMTYRRLHFAAPALLPVADLLLLNEDNPRSAAFQFRRLGRAFSQLPAGTRGVAGMEREKLDQLRSDLASLNLEALTAHDAEAAAAVIPAVCRRIGEGVENLSASLTEHFFSHAARRSE